MHVYSEVDLWRQKSAETRNGIILLRPGLFSSLVSGHPKKIPYFRFNLHDAEGLSIAPILWGVERFGHSPKVMRLQYSRASGWAQHVGDLTSMLASAYHALPRVIFERGRQLGGRWHIQTWSHHSLNHAAIWKSHQGHPSLKDSLVSKTTPLLIRPLFLII